MDKKSYNSVLEMRCCNSCGMSSNLARGAMALNKGRKKVVMEIDSLVLFLAFTTKEAQTW